MHLFIVTLHIFAIFNQLLMALILWLRKNNTLANKILGLIILIPVFAFVNNLLVYLGEIQPVVIILYLNAAIGLLFGPALLYYFHLMLGKKIKLNWKHIVHLIPSFVAIIISLPLLFLKSEEKEALILRVKGGTDDVSNILSLALLIHILFYLYLSWRIQKKHYADVQSYFTDMEHTRYHWVRKFILWLVFLNILFIVSYAVPAVFAPELMKYADLVATPLLTFLIYLFIFIAGFNNHAVFTTTEFVMYEKELIPFNQFVEEQDDKNKYGDSILKEELIEEIDAKLVRLLNEEKPYLDKELNLNKLANLIGISSHQLSQFINRKYNKNYFDFINSYRVEEAKTKLLKIQQSKLTIEGIGTECGFGSPSAFYRAFKKSVGLTPSQFIKQP